MTDEQLIINFKKGNVKAFEVLIKRHEILLFKFINKRVRCIDTVNDLKQNTLIKIHNGIISDNYIAGNFIGWISTIAKNVCIDYYREKRKMHIDYHEKLQVDVAVYQPEINRYEFLNLIKDLRPERKRVVFLISEGYSFREISEMQPKIKINTVLGYYRYSVVELRKKLVADGQFF